MGLLSYLDRQYYASRMKTEKKKLLRDPGRASLPVLSAQEFNYRPIGKEKLVAVHNNVLDYLSANKHRSEPSGLFSSLRYILSAESRAPISVSNLPSELKKKFMGRILLTDRAFVFESGAKNERTTFTQISGVQFHGDGFTVLKRNGAPRIYQISSPDPKFAAVLDILLSRVD